MLNNTTIPDSTLKKKSQSIAYHMIREGVARDEWRTCYVNTNDNDEDCNGGGDSVASCGKGVVKGFYAFVLLCCFCFSFLKWLTGVGDYTGRCIG